MTDGAIGVASWTATGQLRERRIDAYDEGAEDIVRLSAVTTFVLVPGAWLGGWCWRGVAAQLRGSGHAVIAATLTGLGERAHLLGPEVGLSTHAADVANLLKYRDLADTVLVGHSYGGVVITAAAERVPGRLRGLVYLDASTPADGQSNNDVLGPTKAAPLRLSAEQDGEGWRVPPFPIAGWNLPDAVRPWVEERLTPHPLRSLEEPVHRRRG